MRLEQLRPLIPAGLEIDTFDGWAWLGIVPFHLTIRYRCMPLGLSFPEVNVRTYVRCGKERGVWFLSLDAESRLAVMVARHSYALPYHVARMTMRRVTNADGPSVFFASRRNLPCSPQPEFRVDYRPTGDVFTAAVGSLEDWLIEHYQLFTVNPRGRIAHGKIHHRPWQLQTAEADFQINRLVEPLGLRLPPEPPLLHFAREVNAVAWRLQGVDTSACQLVEH
jgi:uncharacterized protein YqjF (DUF2071 family)